MWTRLSSLALLVLAISLASGTAAAKLVAYYPLNEGSGTITADASGNRHTGTIVGTATWVDGPSGYGKALSYNGVNPAAGWVNCGTWDPSAATGQLTVMFWVRWAGPISKDTWQGLVGKRASWDATGANQMWEFEVSASNDTLSFFRGDSYPNCGGCVLPVAQWIHVAATFDGTTLIFYVDGRETGRGAFSLGPGVDAAITIGCDNSGGWNAFNGALDEVRIYDTALPASEIKKMAAHLGATSPIPADGALNPATWVNLTWTSGSTAVYHEVYFGTSYDDVYNGADGTFRSRQVAAFAYYLAGMPDFAYPSGLTLGQTYYWRVDEVDVSGKKFKGPVWSFLVPPKEAYEPAPADASQFVDPNVDLNWSAGLNAVVHHVYFGANFQDVNSGTEGTPVAETTYDPCQLAYDKTYYWRVDEFDGVETHRGQVWSFRTTPAGLGAITQEIYENVAGDLAALKASVNFPDNPTSEARLAAFDTPGWEDAKDNYGGRMHGWVHVPAAGAYTFWIAADDTAELWLSPDGDPCNAELIAGVPAWTAAREWEKYPEQTSRGVWLEAARYYIMALWQDGVSGDHCEVAWQGAGIPNREVIAGTYLEPFRPVSASGPQPAHKATGVPLTSTLRWQAGARAAFHDIYFGQDEQAVAEATPATAGIYQGRQPLTQTAFDPGTLVLGRTYYWRVDEINDGASGSPWKGGVWSFTATDFLVVDDFESYTNDSPNRVFQTWIDGWGFSSDDYYPAGNPGNGTGALVGYDPTSGDIMETAIVHGGRQAMPVDYNNAMTPFYSETFRTWDGPQNWTADGVTELTLHFRAGASASDKTADRVYVVLEDAGGMSATVTHPDPVAVLTTAWVEWKIPLTQFAGVNLSEISRMYIGVGDRGNPHAGGSGRIYIDDIRLGVR